METSNLTAREYYDLVRKSSRRAKFGFGKKPAIVNVDLQCAYTRPDDYVTAYETDPKQLDYVNELSALCRQKKLPVVWTHVAYMASGEDACAWGIRSDTPDSLQNIKEDSPRAAFDPKLAIDKANDIIVRKRMASAFHETNLQSLMTWHGVDTIIVTGGSTSGCVRATVVDGISRGFRVIVPEECVADRHESPHFANLTDMLIKYADIESVATVRAELEKVASA